MYSMILMNDASIFGAHGSNIAESFVLLIGALVLRSASMRAITQISKSSVYRNSRVSSISRVTSMKKLVTMAFYTLVFGGMFSIWGVDRSDLMLYASSMLTVLGIALFAQWSILSNITSTMIIFFNHSAGIGDQVKVIDIEMNIEGTIKDIGLLFTLIENEEGHVMSVPNNVFVQKIVSRLEPQT